MVKMSVKSESLFFLTAEKYPVKFCIESTCLIVFSRPFTPFVFSIARCFKETSTNVSKLSSKVEESFKQFSHEMFWSSSSFWGIVKSITWPCVTLIGPVVLKFCLVLYSVDSVAFSIAEDDAVKCVWGVWWSKHVCNFSLEWAVFVWRGSLCQLSEYWMSHFVQLKLIRTEISPFLKHRDEIVVMLKWKKFFVGFSSLWPFLPCTCLVQSWKTFFHVFFCSLYETWTSVIVFLFWGPWSPDMTHPTYALSFDLNIVFCEIVSRARVPFVLLGLLLQGRITRCVVCDLVHAEWVSSLYQHYPVFRPFTRMQMRNGQSANTAVERM